MNRLLLLILVLSASQSFAQSNQNLLIDVPAKENDILTQRAQVKAQILNRISSRLLNKESGSAKNGDEPLQDVVYVQSGKIIEVCLDTTTITGNFGSLNDMACSSINFGSVTISNNCFSYTATTGVQGRDTLCLELCDTDNNCSPFIFPIRVSPALPPPFFEDFSQSDIVTNQLLWQNSDVFVNKTIGISPPSIGVATFDGIDDNGRPYGGGHGESDKLTSTFIDLNAFSPADDVYFSYWVQPKGYGDRPEFIDSLVLDFKDEDGNWNRVKSYNGIPLDTPSTKQFSFEREAILLSDDKYFHDGFQFRFTNHSTNSGAVDNWHIDYITLVQNSTATASLEDVAFTEIPKPLIYEYTAMPWKHFEAAPELLRDSFTVKLFNHSEQTRTVSPFPFFVEELVTGDNASPSPQPILDNTQRNLSANGPVTYTTKIQGFADYQTDILQDFSGSDSLIFNIFQALQTSFEPVPQRDNSVVNRRTVFDDYFAYDDGSAETNIIAEGRGTEIGVEYTSYVDDSLRAVAISFINITSLDLTKELFNLKIYIDTLDNNPIVENILLKPILTNTLFDTIQSFTTYALIDPNTNEKMAIPIPAGKFYIGFQTASNNPIPIGFDRNSLEAADNNWLALSTGWFRFPSSHQGAVMIRPIFGSGPAITTSTEDNPIVDVSEAMQVYPNPSRGRLNFVSDDLRITTFRYQAFNTLGQMVQRGQLSDEIDFSSLNDGIYYLQLVQQDSQKVYNHKFILSK